MPRGLREVADSARVYRRPVGRDLDRSPTVGQGSGEEGPRRGGMAASGDQHVDDLAVLIDGPVEVTPAAGDPDVGLVDKPPITARVPEGAGRVHKLRRQGLHPAIDRHMIDLDAALAQ